MKTRIALATCVSLFALPLLCVAQNEGESTAADPEDAIIRLDPNAEGLDVWSQIRDTSNDAEREPGLVPTGRLRRPGVLSFFALPLAFTPEDLTAANVDVAILGAPLDMGFRMRGARQGPTALRASIGVSRGSGSLPHMHVGLAWKKELVAVDFGDAPLDGLSVERSMPPVRKLVQECLTGIAMRKKGVTERGNLNPLTVDDEQDDP